MPAAADSSLSETAVAGPWMFVAETGQLRAGFNSGTASTTVAVVSARAACP